MITPDQWMILKIKGDTPHYKIFASWRGGYLGSDSWRMNSGITDVEEDDDFYMFKGKSGSVYRCNKQAYGISTAYNASVMKNFEDISNGLIEIINDMPDIMNMDWII